MITLDLNPEEVQVLRTQLESAISELGMEIANTDRLDFRDQLKERRKALHKVVEQLTHSHATESPPDI